MRKLLPLVLVPVALLCALMGCRRQEAPPPDSLQVVIDRDTLRVLTLYSSTSYFIYRGQDMGFQYELSSQFAHSLGVELQVLVAQSVQEMVERLNSGEADLIAYNLPITNRLKDSVRFCGEETVTHQVIVQRRGIRQSPTLTDVTQLVGSVVHVKPGKHLDRLRNLDKELGGGIDIRVVDNDSISEEDLIRQVNDGQIDLTVADNDLALLNRTYYPRLDVSLAVSYDQRSSWAVRSDDSTLAEAADRWHEQDMTSPAFNASVKRYFEQGKILQLPPPSVLPDGSISIFDALFKEYAPDIHWDWRLLASLAYTESNFDTTAVSWAGARGLMQLMPRTARLMGVPEGKEQNAEESVRAAVKYIGIMSDDYAEIPAEERVKFVLAAYNAGEGHINDARALAEKYGADKNVWTDNVERYLLLKSNEAYYKDSVCRYGYFRGTVTYNFVRDILERAEAYKRITK